MSRSYRLFDILQVLRRHRKPVSAGEIAREMGVSIRTVYRDIVALQALGADIEGEAGVGYVLRPGFLLPPMSFSKEEIQAILTGANWVINQTDSTLALAAQNALAKIAAVLPPDLRNRLEDDSIYVGRRPEMVSVVDLKLIRHAIKEQFKIRITYIDTSQTVTRRTIWPIMLGFVQTQRFVAGWCELREDFRLFRIDRIENAEFTTDHYKGRRSTLVKEWRKREDEMRNEKGTYGGAE
jgi:predicted DNA-binding transcriptional regulator YafY